MQASEREPERPLQNECARPKLVTAACIIWIFEAQIALFFSALFVALGAFAALNKDSAGIWLLMAAVSVLFGCAFIYASIQTYRGKVRDTLGIGSGSIVLGLLESLPMSWFSMRGVPFKMDVVQELPLFLLIGGPLLAAGILALMGRTRYKAWRETQSANRAAEKITQVGQS
jgi:heme/copper-type cytochrome/quinol oxidase subunit 3